MPTENWTRPIDGSGNWVCEHTDLEGNPAPPTQMNQSNAKVERPESLSNQRSRLYCPDCGTLWRVWPETKTTKYYVQRERPDTFAARFAAPPRFRRPYYRDIDSVIESVSQTFPDLVVTQWQHVWPGDDDGVWFFEAPGDGATDIKLDSPNGMCPFVVETNGDLERTAKTVEEAVCLIRDHLSVVKQDG